MLKNIFFHPPLSALPWAMMVVAFCSEFISLFTRRKAEALQEFSRMLSLLAVFGALLAFISGLLASQSLPESASVQINAHYEVGRLSLFCCIGLAILASLLPVAEKKIQSSLRWVYRFVMIGTVILLAFTGHKGSELREERIKLELSQ